MATSVEDMIRRDEGRAYTAYPDPISKGEPWTIGEGHTGSEVHEGLVWDDTQIDDAKQLDIAAAWTVCQNNFEPWFSQLNDARQAVLVCMAFQLGEHGLLEFTATLAAVRDQHFELAADQMRNSLWGHQTPERVQRDAYQMASGAWQ